MQWNSRILAALLCVAALSLFRNTAQAQISVSQPADGAVLTAMPVKLVASVTSCNNNSNITLFEYSIDNSTIATKSPNDGLSTSINTTDYRLSSQPDPGAQYTIHFKAWSQGGACTPVAINITVKGPATTTVPNLDDHPNSEWLWVNDDFICKFCTAGTTSLSTAQQLDGQSRLFSMTYSNPNGGGRRGSINFGSSSTAKHFVYDAYVYLADSSTVQNVEMDNNQSDASGNIWLYGLQCAFDVNGGKWEYTVDNGGASWVESPTLTCPRWTSATWHHVQLAAHRDNTGMVTYDSVNLDGTKKSLSTTVDSYLTPNPLWGPNVLLLNFQLDGEGSSGSITAYVDGLTEIYW